MDVQLRSECKTLLEQLKASQTLLSGHVSSHIDNMRFQDGYRDTAKSSAETYIDPIRSYNMNNNTKSRSLTSSFGKNITSDVNVSKEADTCLKPTMARNKLCSLAKYESKTNSDNTDQSGVQEKENFNANNASAFNRNKTLLSENSGGTFTGLITSIEDDTLNPSSWQSATPNKQRQRNLIDRHTSVPTKLTDNELKSLQNERNLNYSYSHITFEDDVTHLKPTIDQSESVESTVDSTSKSSNTNIDDPDKVKMFQEKLFDDGNSRKLGKLITEATVKPKSILNSTSYYRPNSSSKNTSRVHFNSSKVNTTQDVPDQRLLGYDWIAALLDNDSHLVNQSESFFDDLRDFRKAHKDECSNQFYMQGPHTLVDSEPPEVVEALTEPKVRPYIVNDRLFTEPFKSNLIPDEDYDAPTQKTKDPTKENPRFVRVSIPRSTLQTPYRMKPHRRRSFDAADSCALMEHCLLGWENTRPEMLPAAKSLDLNTEAGTRQDSVVTSLAEAERLARAPRHGAWPFDKPVGRVATLPAWRKHYMDTTLNLSQPQTLDSSRGSMNQSGGSRARLNGGKRATDKLLQQTYSNMYEMERLRQERELERKTEDLL